MRQTVLLFLLFWQTSLLAEINGMYDIKGSSKLLDANMTQFLEKWRHDTITPVQNGTYKNVYVNGDTSKKTVALSFDDAPDENNTHKILDILKKHHVKASFFMIASTMNDDNISAVKRSYDEGHLVLSHSFDHPRFTNLNETQIITQLDNASTKIHTLTGSYPLLFRPPYGSINRQVVDTINASGSTTILWSLDSLDWTLKDPYAVANNVVSNIRNGDIILMHRNATSVASLDMVLETLLSIGYTFTTLDEMLGLKAYR
ncbi:MAG TPA: polysaccharide deacetylase family protein [Sulfuricurvum sp.]|nr:polysaccharide deacetylase family protein [Sulfuricurvum sp.]